RTTECRGIAQLIRGGFRERPGLGSTDTVIIYHHDGDECGCEPRHESFFHNHLEERCRPGEQAAFPPPERSAVLCVRSHPQYGGGREQYRVVIAGMRRSKERSRENASFWSRASGRVHAA